MGFLEVPPVYPTRVRLTPVRLPNWESGPQNQPRAKVAVSNVPACLMPEEDRSRPASETLDDLIILSPLLKETMLTTVINPNKSIRAKNHFMAYDIQD